MKGHAKRRPFSVRKYLFPCETDRLTAREEFLYYFLSWCHLRSVEPGRLVDMGEGLGIGHPADVHRMLTKLKRLHLLKYRVEFVNGYRRRVGIDKESWRPPAFRIVSVRVFALALKAAQHARKYRDKPENKACEATAGQRRISASP